MGSSVKMWAAVVVIVVLTACVAKQDLIVPSKQQRVAAEENYKQCVAQATNKRVYENQDPEAIVRDSIAHCRTSKYAMLKDYPKGWQESYGQQVDEEILKNEIAYVIKTRQQR